MDIRNYFKLKEFEEQLIRLSQGYKTVYLAAQPQAVVEVSPPRPDVTLDTKVCNSVCLKNNSSGGGGGDEDARKAFTALIKV